MVMSIGKKIYAGFGAVLVILIVISAFSIYESRNITSSYEKMLNNRMKQSELSERIQKEMGMQGLYIRAYILQNDENLLPMLQNHQQRLKSAVDELSTYTHSDEMKSLTAIVKENISLFDEAATEVIDLAKAGKTMEALKVLNGEASEANINIEAASVEIIAYQENQLKQERAEVEHTVRIAEIVLWSAIIIGLILGALIAVTIANAVSKPVRSLANAAVRIAEGDLTVPNIEVKSKDEIKELAVSFNMMKDNLQKLISEVNGSALHVTASAEQLSASMDEVARASQELSGNMDFLSNGSKTAAASAQESSVAMEETSGGLQKIAESTQLLKSTAADTMVIAENSEESIETAKGQMALIYNSSNKMSELIRRLSRQSVEIEKITKVITEITEQTNLLSLNAAIEAARAGEHGKGFAVVADEVRKLAEESKQSASQIVSLIAEIQKDTKDVEMAVDESLKNVGSGVETIEVAGEAFTRIIASVNTMSDQIEEISSATEEISASAEEVAASVQEISSQATDSSNTTEQNAAAIEEQMATIEEVNAVAHDLSKQAMELQHMVQRFTI